MGPENERGAAQVMYHARTTRRNKEESDCGKIEKEGDERSGEEDFIGEMMMASEAEERRRLSLTICGRKIKRARPRVHCNEETTRCSTDESVG